jgi:hypothetical protein
MRAFLAACVVAIIISVCAVAVLDPFVQKPVSVAFATTGVRL